MRLGIGHDVLQAGEGTPQTARIWRIDRHSHHVPVKASEKCRNIVDAWRIDKQGSLTRGCLGTQMAADRPSTPVELGVADLFFDGPPSDKKIKAVSSGCLSAL